MKLLPDRFALPDLLVVTICLAVIAFALAGCATPPTISANPVPAVTNPTIVTDLQDAAYNLDSAVAVGALAADDPAPKCLHNVMQKIGVEVPAGAAGASFTPKVQGAASAGAVAYILAQQAKKLGTGVQVDVSCEALVGRVVIDGANTTVKLLPIPAFLKALP